ncbi:hypothetical protein HBH49_132790 [Parastagonospora nodorum]|nr:hypothetical protein HBH49_132790 [Parastagonospora nodorum]KAH4064650.1 hypothetical protein HBH50_173760 [Parastagonospora nodorum]KAH4083832.1 hypothetical protein HBH48_171360 [Parastagonospora nodorum]
MTSPLWEFDINSPTIVLTHTLLREHYVAFAYDLRSRAMESSEEHDTAKNDRFCEALLMGIRLCDARMGKPHEINELVDIRWKEINDEVRPFLPDPLALFVFAPSPIEPIPIHRDPGGGGGHPYAISEESSPPVNDEDEWSDIEDLDLPELANRYGVSYSPLDIRGTEEPWRKLQTRILCSIDDYRDIYMDGDLKREWNYNEIMRIWRAALNLAYRRPKDVDPEEMWHETEEMVELFLEIGGKLNQGHIPGQSGQNSAVESQNREIDDGEIVARMHPVPDVLTRGSSGVVSLSSPSHIPVFSTRSLDPRSPHTTRSMPYVGRREFTVRSPALLNDIMLMFPRAMGLDSRQFPFATENNNAEAHSNPASPTGSSTPPPAQPSSPAQSPSLHPTFPSILHSTTPMSLMPAIVQRNYRQNVFQVLNDLRNATSSNTFHEYLDAYWEHVESQVPEQASEVGAHDVWRWRSMGAPGGGFR